MGIPITEAGYMIQGQGIKFVGFRHEQQAGMATPSELSSALTESIASKQPCLINVQLAADSGKESGHIGYLNPAPLIDITV